MKRISLMLLCLCAAAWTSGCCHSHYSRCGDFDDNCDCNQTQTQKRSRHRHCRGDKSERGGKFNNCNDCCDDCCNPCGGESGTYPGQSSQPMTYEGGAAMGGGCSNCGSTSMTGSMPMYSGTSGMPFPPGEGWTMQSTASHPVGNEPIPAPGSTPITPTPARAQGWNNPSSVPVPAPVPPPVSYNR